jgi:hypothetical protein
MTATDFIINRINELIKVFPNVRVRYENHQLSNTHFVEVVPNEVYRLNEEFQLWEETVVFQFIEKFPDQNLCFITDDAIVGIETVNYEAKGDLYDLLYSINDGCYQQVEVTNIHSAISGQSISTIIIEQPTVVFSRITGLSFQISNNSSLIKYGTASCLDAGRPSIENTEELIYPQAA